MDEFGDRSLILYDGVCGLCNRLNAVVLKRDSRDHFRFASLQSSTARSILLRHGKDPADLDTLYLVLQYANPNQKLLSRSSAALEILSQLNPGWACLAKLLRLVPSPLRDLGYRLIAKVRYRIFGKHDSCLIPKKEWQAKFLEV